MKHRRFSTVIIIIIFVIGITLLLQNQSVRTKQNRIHQHLEYSGQTNLPILAIETSGQRVPGSPLSGGLFETSEKGEKEITVSLSVFDPQKGANSIADEPSLEAFASIRYRGNSSRYFDKKSYKLDLVSGDGSELKSEMLGMESHNKWILNGPFLDRTLMRNYLAMNLAGQIMDYAPNVRYCELYVDGDYQGVYLLMESITRGESRVPINKPKKNSIMVDYIIRLDREGKGSQQLNDYSLYANRHADSAINVQYPGPSNMTEARMDFIERDVSKFEKVLYSYDLSHKEKGYRKYIDLNEFADFFILNEFFGDSDAGRFSTFYYKTVRGKFIPVVWDFNNSADNYIDYPKDETKFSMLDIPIFDALLTDKTFIDTVITRYRLHRKDILSEEYLMAYVDELNDWLGDSVDRNYEKWGYVFDLSNYDGMNFLTPVERNHSSHEEAVKQLKTYLRKRGEWLDENIETLYQHSHESRNINNLLK